jgi:hypothetical protein
MSSPGKNEGFRTVEEFICEAIYEPPFPQGTLKRNGSNGGPQPPASNDTPLAKEPTTDESRKAEPDDPEAKV